jgi:hypothetical protein
VSAKALCFNGSKIKFYHSDVPFMRQRAAMSSCNKFTVRVTPWEISASNPGYDINDFEITKRLMYDPKPSLATVVFQGKLYNTHILKERYTMKTVLH